jgi:adenylate cyclase
MKEAASLRSAPTERVVRRLAAVVCADVVGFSRLVERDEERTIRRVRENWDSLVRPNVQDHGGRVVKLMGDGALLEFPSVVEAVRCLLEVQEAVAAREASRGAKDRIQYRVGIHLGDVIVDGDDIQGHGVNVAARLESLAAPGGVCVSEAVRTALGHALALTFTDLGAVEVKNIAEPVRAYRTAPMVVGQRAPRSGMGRTGPHTARRLVLGAMLLALVAGGAFIAAFGRWPWRPQEPARVAVDGSRPAAIAVLPFVNLSHDGDQEFFADGLTEDLIVDLSKLSSLLVISRNTSFSYKDQAVPPREVAEDLGVTHVLSGSVRRAGDRVRVTAQLVDALNDQQLWAQRFDRQLTDIFAVEDEINREIIAALADRLVPEDLAKSSIAPTTSIEAYEYFLRGRDAMNLLTRRSLRLAYHAFEKAIALDPGFAEAHASLAMTYAIDVTGTSSSWSDWVRPPGRARAQAALLAAKAASLKPELATPELVMARLSLAEWRYDEAIEHARRALERQPGDAEAYATLSLALTAAGRHGEALVQVKEALRRDPKAPPSTYGTFGIVQFGLRDYEGAIDRLERSFRGMIAGGSWFYAPFLVAAHGAGGRADPFLESVRSGRDGPLNVSLASVRFNHFYERPEDMRHLLDRLREAGVQEFPPEFDARQEGAERIPGSVLAGFLHGRSFEALCLVPRLNAEFRFAADGRLTWTARHDVSDTGYSRIAGDDVCVTLPVITRGREACFSVFKVRGANLLTKNYNLVLAGPSLCYLKEKG